MRIFLLSIFSLFMLTCDSDPPITPEDIYGCMDDEACNYNPEANVWLINSCTYDDEYYDCDGNCILEEDCSGNCNNMCLNIHSVFKQFDELALDDNGYYHFNYPDNVQQNPNDYGTVYYSTSLPMQRVGWMSTDTFYVEHMGQIIAEPVINFSTYWRSDRGIYCI